MKNLTCKTCASNSFKEEEKHYVCTYCNTIIIKKYSIEKKRILLISSVLSIVTVGLFLAYILLFDVKEDITTLSQQNTDTPLSSQMNNYDATNPFSNMILKVEKKIGDSLENNVLEKALLKYFIQEENKAFYIVITPGGEYAFGMSQAATSIMIAEKEAKKACNEAKTSKSIKGECIPYAINSHVSQFLINN